MLVVTKAFIAFLFIGLFDRLLYSGIFARATTKTYCGHSKHIAAS
jgi:hypothetical protein